MNDARRAYQESAVYGAKPVRLTILLYEQIIQDVSRAAEAISVRNFEAVAREIGHATGVIGYLQATLKREKGAAVVRNLSKFYTMLREKLMEAQVRSSREILDRLRENMVEVREAWLKVETDADHLPAEKRS
jgi:flagellar biosynthetic protein FliS